MQLTHEFTEHLGMSLVWQYYRLKVDHDNWVRQADITFSYHGPTVLLHYQF
ncbi:hypothetical protein [Ferrimonas pelagia]|uniref:Uncharacterized protein n=1 Tax=Ferrimonas pelagia TaxID=1177826 RepID=A0ABP9EWP8_9GAMM